MDFKIKVSQREIIIMRRIFENSFDCLFEIDSVHLYLKKENLNEIKEDLNYIIDTVSDYFISNGLDKKDEPTSFGLEIENLQDKFLNLLWTINT